MRAVVFDFNLPRLALARVLGTFSARGFLTRLGPVRLADVPDPRPLGEDWVVVRPKVTGVCGSDVKQVFLDADVDNPLRALISFPHVLGHEVAAEVVETGRKTDGLRVGQRVAISPWLPCEVRKLPPCPACQRGDLTLCDGFTRGDLAPGMHAGNCRDVPGGYAELMIAHRSMCFPIPDGVPTDAAALADPFSVALHAIRKAPPRDGETALVYGCGPLGLMTVHALSRLYPRVTVLAVDVNAYLQPMAQQLGAHAFFAGKGAPLIERVADHIRAPLKKVRWALPWVLGGVDRVYDTVGIAQTLETAVRLVRPTGTVVLVGVGTPRRFEWTPIFFREVTLVGSNAYGVETFEGQRRHGFDYFLELCDRGRVQPVRMVTHRLPLARYADAFVAARQKARHQAVKVLIEQG